jgi:beta-glucosidase
VLGPGVNVKRSPLCGRNFEYVSEDPLLAGDIGAALVRGIQSQGTAASLKHFAANNQETERMRVSADIDERTLREIYLKPFERVVKQAQPRTVMSSYNRVNGTFVGEDARLTTSILRDEWGFDGLVMSDWGAVNDRVAGVTAGLDLEMPSSGGRRDAEIVAAVQAGTLSEGAVDAASANAVALVQAVLAARVAGGAPGVVAASDAEAHHALAREAASRAIVLLKNEHDTLPLAPDRRIAVIGEFAHAALPGGGLVADRSDPARGCARRAAGRRRRPRHVRVRLPARRG